MITDALFVLHFNGSVVDITSNDRDFTAVGSITYGSGPWSNRQAAIGLNATNYCRNTTASLTTAMANLASWSFMGTCRRSTFGSYPAGMSFAGSSAANAVVLYPFKSNGGDGTAVFAFNAERMNTASSHSANAWTKFGLTYSGGTLSLYVNNVTPVTVGSLSLTMPASPIGFYFGNFHNGGTPNQGFGGDWADARFFNRAFTAADWTEYMTYAGSEPSTGDNRFQMGIGLGL